MQTSDAALLALFGDLADEADLYAHIDDAPRRPDDFDEIDEVSGFRDFKFGDYSGKVAADVYDLFVVRYQATQQQIDEVMLSDVLGALLRG